MVNNECKQPYDHVSHGHLALCTAAHKDVLSTCYRLDNVDTWCWTIVTMASLQPPLPSEAHFRGLVTKLASASRLEQGCQIIKQIKSSYTSGISRQWMDRLCAPMVEVEGAIGALIALLSGPQEDVALMIFSLLSNMESFRHAIHPDHIPVMSTLASLMDSPSPNLQQPAVIALGLLAESMALARAAAEAGVVEKLVKLLRGESGSRVAWIAARALFPYVYTSRNRARKAAVAGAMPHMSKLIITTSAAEGQRHASASITAILNYVPPSKLPERQVNLAVDAATHLIRHAIDEWAHLAAVNLLGQLRRTGGPTLGDRMLNAGVLEHIMQHLPELPPDRQIDNLGLMAALQQLAAAARWEVVSRPAFVLTEGRDAEARMWAACVLAPFLAAAPEVGSLVGERFGGIVSAMVRAIAAEGTSFKGLMLHALAAMLLCPGDAELVDQAVAAGVLPLLLAALQVAQEVAVSAAVNVACNPSMLFEPEKVPEAFGAVVEQIIRVLRSAAGSTGSTSESATQSWLMALYNAALKSAELAERIDNTLGPVLREYQQAGKAGRSAASGASGAAAAAAQRLRDVLQVRRQPGASLAGFQTGAVCGHYTGVDQQGRALVEAEAEHQLAHSERAAVRQAQLAACAKGGATSKREGGGPLLRCSTCQAVAYCSKGCQKEHWRVHKKGCRS